MQKRRLNLKFSTKVHSQKYHLYAPEYAANPMLPAAVDLRSQDVPIFDQGDLGSCTGQGWAEIMDFIQKKQLLHHVPVGQSPEEFSQHFTPVSRLFIYYNERVLNNCVNEDSGAQIGDGALAIQRFGICRESIWPYIESAAFQKPSDACYKEASHHLISGAYQIASLQDMKQCLYHGYPIVLGIMVYDSFMSDEAASSGVIPMPNRALEQIQGGHCVVCVGYDDNKKHMIMRNSWGASWGDKGYFYLPYDFIQDPNLTDSPFTVRV